MWIMWFAVFKSLEGLDYYGDIPELPEDDRTSRVELYEFNLEREYWDEFEKEFIFPMWEKFRAIFDFGDVDYFDAAKCAKIKVWVEEKLTEPLNPIFVPIFEKFLEFTTKAIEYNTGVKVAL